MIVIALWVPYLATKGIGMRQFMELQAVFALVILCGELPSGLLSDMWGRKKTLLLGSTLKAVSFSLPLLSSYEGFLFYHLTMGIALSMISGGDVALLYDSYLAAAGEKSRGTEILGNAKLAAQTGTTVGALVGGAVVTLSYGHLLWANAILSWIPVLRVLRVTEPLAALDGHGSEPVGRAQRVTHFCDLAISRAAMRRLACPPVRRALARPHVTTVEATGSVTSAPTWPSLGSRTRNVNHLWEFNDHADRRPHRASAPHAGPHRPARPSSSAPPPPSRDRSLCRCP
jgi:MFS family permease